MEFRRMGRTGLKVSTICLGTMNFGWSADEATSFAIIDASVEAGINFIDTADIYSYWVAGNKGGESETIIGNWLQGKERHKFVIATKVRGPMWKGVTGEGLSRQHIMQACEDSLRRLKTDYIDLYQVHYPDNETPLDETMRALDDLVRAGKVRYLGASNYPAWMMMKSQWLVEQFNGTRFDCIQPHHSLLHRSEYERELEPMCLDQGIGVIPYSPLAAGFLTGKYTRENRSPESARSDSGLIQQLTKDDDAYNVLDEVRAIANAHGVPMAHVALAWQLARPSVTSSIIGARTVGQLGELLGAVDLKLSDEEIGRLNAVSHKY